MRAMIGTGLTAAAVMAGAATAGPSPAGAEPNAKVMERAEAYKQPTLDLLERLVNQDSGSHNEAGLLAVADMAVKDLEGC